MEFTIKDIIKSSEYSLDEYKTRLVKCYELVISNLTKNLLTGFDATDPTKYYNIGQFKFVKEREYIAQGLIEILYNMRNSLFHGELIPTKKPIKYTAQHIKFCVN